jgi:predicted CopG family antitoxin
MKFNEEYFEDTSKLIAEQMEQVIVKTQKMKEEKTMKKSFEHVITWLYGNKKTLLGLIAIIVGALETKFEVIFAVVILIAMFGRGIEPLELLKSLKDIEKDFKNLFIKEHHIKTKGQYDKKSNKIKKKKLDRQKKLEEQLQKLKAPDDE